MKPISISLRNIILVLVTSAVCIGLVGVNEWYKDYRRTQYIRKLIDSHHTPPSDSDIDEVIKKEKMKHWKYA